ncbi:Crp/Fnr family transcriptional regulator [Tistrella bauzanensis]|jgi:CRP-like cAMP-binding protein|uniref:Crp/Fnr family transcriptional regulator n=1 Tax=Tistrella arctica TaxID=3133430 RepID=A0ABU9YK62_9PROT
MPAPPPSDQAPVDAGIQLTGLPEDAARLLAAAGTRRRLGDGQLIHAKGDEADALFGIVSGAVRIASAGNDGRELIIAVLEPGEWFGEIALIDGGRRTHDAVTLGETELLVVPKPAFHRLLADHATLSHQLLVLLCRRLRMTFSALEDEAFLPLDRRLAKRLLALADAYGEPDGAATRIALHLPQEELGHMLGASRQTINRLLGTWARDGLIIRAYGRITLTDRAALTRIACA